MLKICVCSPSSIHFRYTFFFFFFSEILPLWIFQIFFKRSNRREILERDEKCWKINFQKGIKIDLFSFHKILLRLPLWIFQIFDNIIWNDRTKQEYSEKGQKVFREINFRKGIKIDPRSIHTFFFFFHTRWKNALYAYEHSKYSRFLNVYSI